MDAKQIILSVETFVEAIKPMIPMVVQAVEVIFPQFAGAAKLAKAVEILAALKHDAPIVEHTYEDFRTAVEPAIEKGVDFLHLLQGEFEKIISELNPKG